MNPLNPDRMSAKERLAEVTRLLALGLIRLRARQSSRTICRHRREFATLSARPERSCETETTEKRMTDPIPARLAALKTMPMPELKAQWRELFETEPPQFNRRALENRLAYRIQELAYGGLKPETLRRLEILGEQYDSGSITTRRIRHDARPVAGTRLVREYRGVEHTVTVLADGYEWQGRPYRSLSAIARAITGTRWNGLVFFGIKRQGSAA